ncbi:uncharacterized protein HMPREF1120_02969 [Exophiala dermatitidis NIH/UT8656]|uniref:Uncharacterized protein n=1 Tax=Exophiala dermatitidis (strain ATCC 34100 / CBS 525.76 / NIH/UT8656) TaxID=858893 RepID=H6BRX7_EXODN|nr:uncharacterized protein HMPREF1120_02969 [Exophiala dermatitidis NIH/UT8656]EHY54805.1 hypothetical protein HMPREF1120_02969 [Exophiala dermatitidis NIH/UT8656]
MRSRGKGGVAVKCPCSCPEGVGARDSASIEAGSKTSSSGIANDQRPRSGLLSRTRSRNASFQVMSAWCRVHEPNWQGKRSVPASRA